MATMNELTKAIEVWSIHRNLNTQDPSKQFLKVTEELGELAAGMARQDKTKIIDSIGDLYVTIVILAQQYGLSIEECVDIAYTEIADRIGVIKDGVFVKLEELDNA